MFFKLKFANLQKKKIENKIKKKTNRVKNYCDLLKKENCLKP